MSPKISNCNVQGHVKSLPCH